MVFFTFTSMHSQDFLEYISSILGLKIRDFQSVSGGDISTAYLIETSSNKFFLKVNSNPNALDMFLAEEKALSTIANTNTIATPKVVACSSFGNDSFILMEHIEAKAPNSYDLELFGNQLAQLHNVTSDEFGFDSNNFIGSLHQSNIEHNHWNDFYIEERLIPQFQLAKSKGLLQTNEIPIKERMKEICFFHFKNVKPSLLHGDLWNGNYLISSEGIPYLIDPAVYYGHCEVDISMSKLFGGFGKSFYQSYYDIINKDEFTESRIELYQLYYLLVHLNLFGRSYYPSVINLLKKYFKL